MSSEILVSFLGAVQASLSVLLTISFGVAAAQFGLVTTQAAEEISRLCVKVLLPCLMITKLGSELHLDTAVNYVPIISMSISPASETNHFAIVLLTLPTYLSKSGPLFSPSRLSLLVKL